MYFLSTNTLYACIFKVGGVGGGCRGMGLGIWGHGNVGVFVNICACMCGFVRMCGMRGMCVCA